MKIHGGDAMEIPEQSVIANALGLSGYPSASIDRKNFGGSVFLSRGVWKPTCESQMQQKAKAEVDCFCTLDKRTRTVRIQVMANIVESMDFPLRFNAYIVEDDVTGQGPGYDQSNYLSGRPGFENNPYYSQPSKIVGYHHMKVVRTMIGGPWGVAGDLPPSVKAGDFYSHEFVSHIDDRWKIDDVFFVGMLQANAPENKEIINSALAIEGGSLLNRIIDSNAPTVRAMPSVSDFNNVYTLENATNEEQTYTVTLSTTDKTPEDWSAGFTSGTTELTASGTDGTTGQIVVAANSTAELSLTLKTGQTLGLGDAKMILELQGTPTITRSRVISGISAEIEKVLLETGPDYSLQPYLNGTDHNDIITLDPSDYLAFADDMTNLKLVIWNKGPSGSLSPDEIDVIKNSGNVSNFVCGCRVIGGLRSSGSLGFFGLEWIGWNLEGLGSNGAIRISGQEGDVITGRLGENIRGRLMQYYVNMVRITDTANVFPIMHFQNNGHRQYGNSVFSVRAEDAIFGVRTAKNNTRTVLLGISPYVVSSTDIRRTLIHNILDWLVVDERADGFLEDFETGDFMRFPWIRSGDSDWTITSGERRSGAYSARAGLIEDGQASTLTGTFDCNDGDVSFYCRVSSESRFDYLRFSIDGVEKGQWSGEQDWTQVSFPVNEGTRTFEWTYLKDGSASEGDDTAWIDDIVFPGK
ncbi:MAG: Omp28-related outer membrane protein [Planctomycetota bacterium]